MHHARNDWNGRIIDNAHEIPEAEPVFLIRGQDRYASEMIEVYISLVRKDRIALEDDAASAYASEYKEEGDEKMNEAAALYNVEKLLNDHATRIRLWPKKKSPDLPEAEAPQRKLDLGWT